MNEKVEKSMLKVSVGVIVIVCAIIGSMYWYQNQKIITSKGVMYDKNKLLMHDLLDGEEPFGEETVAFKFGNGYCAEVSRNEVSKVKEQLLNGEKILDAIDARSNVFSGNHVIWYVNKNLVTEEKDSDFTTRYFSTELVCKDYMTRKDVYHNSYKSLKELQEQRLNKGKN